jgi:hypothetical protein
MGKNSFLRKRQCSPPTQNCYWEKSLGKRKNPNHLTPPTCFLIEPHRINFYILVRVKTWFVEMCGLVQFTKFRRGRVRIFSTFWVALLATPRPMPSPGIATACASHKARGTFLPIIIWLWPRMSCDDPTDTALVDIRTASTTNLATNTFSPPSYLYTDIAKQLRTSVASHGSKARQNKIDTRWMLLPRTFSEKSENNFSNNVQHVSRE